MVFAYYAHLKTLLMMLQERQNLPARYVFYMLKSWHLTGISLSFYKLTLYAFYFYTQPTVNPISVASASNAGFAERVASVVGTSGMVCIMFSFSLLLPSIYLWVKCDILPFEFFFLCQNGDARNVGDVKPRITEETNDKSKVWKLTEITEPCHCRALKLPENLRVTKV